MQSSTSLAALFLTGPRRDATRVRASCGGQAVCYRLSSRLAAARFVVVVVMVVVVVVVFVLVLLVHV